MKRQESGKNVYATPILFYNHGLRWHRTNGYRMPLLKVEGRLNSEAYIKLLIENKIIEDLNENFGINYVFQQDNAPCHKSALTKKFLLERFPAILPWLPKSPDLNLVMTVSIWS